MAEDEIEIQIGDVKVNPIAIAPSPTGQLLELGENVLPSLAVDAGDTLANLASGITDSSIVPGTGVPGGQRSGIVDSGIVPVSGVSGGQRSGIIDSGISPGSDVPGGQRSGIIDSSIVPGSDVSGGQRSGIIDSGISPGSDVSGGQGSGVIDSGIVPGSDVPGGQGSLLKSGTAFSRGLVATEQKTPPSAVSVVAGEPTASQIEKVYDATNLCRSNAEIMKITGLNMNTVVACVAWLTKKGWIVTDDNKRACSIEAVGKYREKFKKLCDWCNK